MLNHENLDLHYIMLWKLWILKQFDLQIKSMKEMYYVELNEMYVKIATKLQQVTIWFSTIARKINLYLVYSYFLFSFRAIGSHIACNLLMVIWWVHWIVLLAAI